MTIQDDITRRSADIHWPDGLTPADADLFAHNEIIIDAPPQQIWQHLIAATAWPRWYSNSANVVVNDPSELLAGQLARANPGRMHRGHDLWNISLKFLCET